MNRETVAWKLHDRDRQLLAFGSSLPSDLQALAVPWDKLTEEQKDVYRQDTLHFRWSRPDDELSIDALRSDRDSLSDLLKNLQAYVDDLEDSHENTVKQLQEDNQRLTAQVDELHQQVKNLFAGLLTPEAFQKIGSKNV